VATSDPIAEIIGDYRAFAAMQRDRLVGLRQRSAMTPEQVELPRRRLRLYSV